MSTKNLDQQQAFATLCSNGCGFFSSVDTEGLCSVCYKDKMKKSSVSTSSTTETSSTQTEPQPSPVSSSATTTIGSTITTSSSSPSSTSSLLINTETQSSSSVEKKTETEVIAGSSKTEISPRKTSHPEDSEEPVPAKKPKKNKCQTCKKKVGLTGFDCRCGGLFCSIHRYSDKHECSFDYKAMGEKEISSNNPMVVAQKIAKI